MEARMALGQGATKRGYISGCTCNSHGHSEAKSLISLKDLAGPRAASDTVEWRARVESWKLFEGLGEVAESQRVQGSLRSIIQRGRYARNSIATALASICPSRTASAIW